MSKVRIYELSKELNLENKDILSICKRLSIAVKSHSSTITESEAEQIRASAKGGAAGSSQAANGKSAGSEAVATRPSRPTATKPAAPVRPKPPQKKPRSQEILAVRKRSPDGGRSSDEGASHEGGDDRPTHDAATPATTPNTGPSRLAAPPRVDRPELQEAPAMSSASPPKPRPRLNSPRRKGGDVPLPASDGSAGGGSSSPPRPARLSAPPSRPGEIAAPQAREHESRERDAREDIGDGGTSRRPAPTSPTNGESAAAAPKLVGPPARPGRPKPPVEVRRIEARGVTPPRPKPATASETSGGDEAPPSPRQKLVAPPRPTLAGPPTRPARPSKPGAGVSAAESQREATDSDTDEATGVGVEPEDSIEVLEQKRQPLKLRRPVARPQPEWEDGPDKSKVAKTTAKAGKRRSKSKIEDEDFVEPEEGEVGQGWGAPGSSPMSLARPPKPDSMASKKPATRATTAAKPKRQSRGQRSDSRDRRREQQEATPQRPEIIELGEELTVQELASRVAMPETEIVKLLFFKGIAATITQTLDLETARMVLEELGVLVDTPEETSAATKTEMLDTNDLENLRLRPPVVTIMGHVDHGKTSLLDKIRKAKVAEGEAGGITQHIGAYHVDVELEGEIKQVVFLDTPGHQAFTAMRARGASITDISVLVVAADDGVRPQTREAIGHAKAAGVPLIVAINKIDKAGAEPERVKQELTEEGLVPEEWGGDTVMVAVSAHTGENLDELLENILLVSEIEELMANPDRPAKGTVIEANLDRARGPVATLLVQNGTLRVGDVIVAGSTFGKVRAMIDDRGHRVEAARPSFAVEILGLNAVPSASDEFEVYPSEKEARAIALERGDRQRQSRLLQAGGRRVSLKTLSEQAQEGELKELNIILKADVQGSIEAILGSLKQMPQGEVQIRPLLAAPGEITETDIDLAAASGAVVVGFNTTLATGARELADDEGVDVRVYDVIYKLFDDIEAAMEGLLDPEEVEEPLGEAEVRAIFPVGRGAVAGCYIRTGRVVRNRNIRVRRSGEVIFTGYLDSLKRMKDDVKEVNTGFECGIRIDKFNDWQEGDIIEVFEMVMQRRKLAQV